MEGFAGVVEVGFEGVGEVGGGAGYHELDDFAAVELGEVLGGIIFGAMLVYESGLGNCNVFVGGGRAAYVYEGYFGGSG